MTRTLLRGATVLPVGDPASTAVPVTAMAVEDGVITWLGTDDGARAYADGADSVLDLDGALVTPAFVDAHVHATSTGLVLEGLDLSGAADLQQALRLVADHARRARGGALLGHGWDETRWPEGRPPTRTELDRASYGGVVYLTRIDVHSAVVSSALVAAAPEVRTTPGWRDDGWVSREAHHVVRRVARSSLSSAQRTAAQRATLARAAAQGIGCLHELAGPDVSSADDLRSFMTLAAAEPWPEVVAYWGELGGIERARELGARGAAGDLFVDGAIGSRTAALRTVYADEDTFGHAYLSAEHVRDHVMACTTAGLQAGFHAIGDRALDLVAAGFDEAAAALGDDAVRAARHRIEHVEMADDAVLTTLGRLGVVASVQPAFDRLWGGDGDMYARRLGAERALPMNAFASMARAGMTLAFGSDTPVTPLDPWDTIRAAVAHSSPHQRLDPTVAFAAHTRGGWQAAGVDDGGVLAAGAPATYAVWDATAFPSMGPGDPLPRCLRTVVRGRTVFDTGVFDTGVFDTGVFDPGAGTS